MKVKRQRCGPFLKREWRADPENGVGFFFQQNLTRIIRSKKNE
jgi:hypothetical protein